MTKDDRADGGKVNACSCGFSTSLIRYMLQHLMEGNCKPSDAQCFAVRQRMSEIHTSKMALADAVQKLNDEEYALSGILALAAKPIVKAKKPRACCICGKSTNDLFGEVPQCLRHTGGKQEMVVKGKVFTVSDQDKRKVSDIIEGLLYGNSGN